MLWTRTFRSTPSDNARKLLTRAPASIQYYACPELDSRKQEFCARKRKSLQVWKAQKDALLHKFGSTGWRPRKRLSPDTLEGIRRLHESDKSVYSSTQLATHFKVSPEAIRRILKSKWRPVEDELLDRRLRWLRRGFRKWEDIASFGAKAPSRWRTPCEEASHSAQSSQDRPDSNHDLFPRSGVKVKISSMATGPTRLRTAARGRIL